MDRRRREQKQRLIAATVTYDTIAARTVSPMTETPEDNNTAHVEGAGLADRV
jgi:hypothetical protein